MTNMQMTPDEEYEFYARPENQQPQGPPRRRRPRLSAPIPVRFPPELLDTYAGLPTPTTVPCRRGFAGQ